MLGILKSWFRRAPDPAPPASRPPSRAPSPGLSSQSAPPTPTAPRLPNRPVVRAVPPAGTTCEGGLELPLNPILALLPANLQSRLQQTYPPEVCVSIPVDKILPQLAGGEVKIPFGELRRAAPPGTFLGGADQDHQPVVLPLADILARINPTLLPRRPAQKRLTVPEDITGPFDGRGQGLIFSVAATKPESVPPAPGPTHVPPRRNVTPVVQPPAPLAGAPTPRIPIPGPSPAASPRMEPAARPTIPAPPAGPGAGRLPTPRAAAAPPPPAGNGAVLSVPLNDVAAGWPEAVRAEIAAAQLAGSLLALPLHLVEEGLKVGKVTFPWKQLRSWLRPTPLNGVSASDNTMLELPLQVVAPLFLARQKAAKPQPRLTVDQSIPDLFFGPNGAPPPAPVEEFIPPPPTPKVVDTNYYVWNETQDTPQDAEVLFKRSTGTPSTAFLRRYATPNEIVSKAAALDGVEGALIALPDGLLVASRLPAEVNGETLAAFLPQIFGRVNQSTRELRMGDLNNLSFTVGGVPWKIFRVGAIFFAAFGRAQCALPGAQLAALAAELDRKPIR